MEAQNDSLDRQIWWGKRLNTEFINFSALSAMKFVVGGVIYIYFQHFGMSFAVLKAYVNYVCVFLCF